LLDTVPDNSEVQPDIEVMLGGQKDKLNLLLNTLDDREADIIRIYYGFDGEGGTLQSIGKKYSLSRERIRQIKKAAIKKLQLRSRVARLVISDFSLGE